MNSTFHASRKGRKVALYQTSKTYHVGQKFSIFFESSGSLIANTGIDLKGQIASFHLIIEKITDAELLLDFSLTQQGIEGFGDANLHFWGQTPSFAGPLDVFVV